MERVMGVFKRINIGLAVVAFVLLSCAPLAFVGSVAAADKEEAAMEQDGHGEASSALMTDAHAKVSCWAFVAAALATGIGSVAAGYAVANVGTAAMGAVAEKPELMGKSLIYVALAEGIAIYGLLIAIIVLAKV
jgi:V/A-type H+-transporting ATPase subunit K